MFWTKVSKALSDIIMVIALVMGLLLGEGFGEILDSPLIGVAGFCVGVVLTVVAGIAMKSLTGTSDSLVMMLDKLEDNTITIKNPKTLEELEEYEKEMADNEEVEEEEENQRENTYNRNINDKWKNLATETKVVWVETLILLVLTIIISYKISLTTPWGAMLALGFGLVGNMMINAIIGTAVENKYKLERVNFLMRTRNIRKRMKEENKS